MKELFWIALAGSLSSGTFISEKYDSVLARWGNVWARDSDGIRLKS